MTQYISIGFYNGLTAVLLVCSMFPFSLIFVIIASISKWAFGVIALIMGNEGELTRNAFHNNSKHYNSQTEVYGSRSRSSYGYVLCERIAKKLNND